MKYIYDDWNNLEMAFSNAGKYLKELIESPDGLDFLYMCLIYLSTREGNLDKVNKTLIEYLSNKGGELSMTIAETLRKEGEERGEARGEVKGELKAKKRIAATMLQEGFEISIISKISGLSIEEINKIKAESYN